MVNHFKDRVSYFEIGNEWEGGGWKRNEPDKLKWYRDVIMKPTLDLIKRLTPESKVALGAPCSFNTALILGCLEDGVAEKIDGIGWHSANVPNNEYFITLENSEKNVKSWGSRANILSMRYTPQRHIHRGKSRAICSE